jgi:hypothetical protein
MQVAVVAVLTAVLQVAQAALVVEALALQVTQMEQAGLLIPAVVAALVGLHRELTKHQAQAALASSSSRSTNKDLWKLKSTDFSA